MPVDGISLFGFLQEREGIGYVQRVCHPPNTPTPQAKIRWLLAKERLGAAYARAGAPARSEIPPDPGHAAHLARVQANPRYGTSVQGMVASFKLVEPGPLLAFQYHLENHRTSGVCTGIGSPPSVSEMLPICLPTTPIGPPAIPIETHLEAKGYRIISPDKNLRVINWGPWCDPSGQIVYDPNQAIFLSGIGFGEGSSLVQVVLFQGRCFLKNGYHRVCALARQGAPHIPCLFLEATDYLQVDDEPRGHFNRALLESSNPPTLAHFIEDRACAVTLRSTKREIYVQWGQNILFD